MCPAPKGKAIVMKPIDSQLERKEDVNTDYLFNNVSYKDKIMGKGTVKGSQVCKTIV